jgi:hypothetical protein
MAIQGGISIQISDIEKGLPVEIHGLLAKREGAALLAQELPKFLLPSSVSSPTPQQGAWEQVGLFYLQQGRWYEAILIFAALYDQMLAAQEETSIRFHKGMPLVWMSDCYRALGYTVISLVLPLLVSHS